MDLLIFFDLISSKVGVLGLFSRSRKLFGCEGLLRILVLDGWGWNQVSDDVLRCSVFLL